MAKNPQNSSKNAFEKRGYIKYMLFFKTLRGKKNGKEKFNRKVKNGFILYFATYYYFSILSFCRHNNPPQEEGSVAGTLLKLLFTLVFAFIGFFIILIIWKILSIFFDTVFIGVSIMKKGCHIF